MCLQPWSVGCANFAKILPQVSQVQLFLGFGLFLTKTPSFWSLLTCFFCSLFLPHLCLIHVGNLLLLLLRCVGSVIISGSCRWLAVLRRSLNLCLVAGSCSLLRSIWPKQAIAAILCGIGLLPVRSPGALLDTSGILRLLLNGIRRSVQVDRFYTEPFRPRWCQLLRFCWSLSTSIHVVTWLVLDICMVVELLKLGACLAQPPGLRNLTPHCLDHLEAFLASPIYTLQIPILIPQDFHTPQKAIAVCEGIQWCESSGSTSLNKSLEPRDMLVIHLQGLFQDLGWQRIFQSWRCVTAW